MIAAAVHPTASMPRHLLGNRLMVYIGQRSYGLYLFHWPVFQMYRRFAGKGLTPYEFVLLALLSLALTELSYRYIEMPIRDGRFAAWRQRLRDERLTPSAEVSAARRRRASVVAVGAVLPMFAFVSIATADVKLNDISQSLADSESAVVDLLGADTPLVLFLTVHVPSEPRQSINNRLINALPQRYGNVKVLDWFSIAGQYPEYLYSDKTHLRPAGARFYADLIMQSVGRL
ncbi:MAG: acyltransferase [Actinobacteria bacterium]|nr:acyltransferase [Actinomycetota bacterium]